MPARRCFPGSWTRCWSRLGQAHIPQKTCAHSSRLMRDISIPARLLLMPTGSFKDRHMTASLLYLYPTATAFRAVRVYPRGGYQTPLGIVEVDEALALELMRASGFKYIPAAHTQDHTIEVQIPFIQKTLPAIKNRPHHDGDST